MNKLSELLGSGKMLLAAGVQDALSARIAERHGFDAVLLGGYDLGAVRCVSEPLLTLTEMVLESAYITRAVDVPLIVDGGAGFGEPMHVVRTVEDLLQVGVSAIQIEDQIFPKRAHYYASYQEHTIPLEDMCEKIRWAKKAGGDDMFVLGRTDTFTTEGSVEAIRRCNAMLEAGADAVTGFPNSMEEAAELPSKVNGPVFYGCTHGSTVGRPMLTPNQAEEMGYAVHWDCHGLLFSGFEAMERAAASFTRENGWNFGFDTAPVRTLCDEVVGVPRLLEIEKQTVEA
jgi:2-methylisocitrate lyase-like PEP mutase family enzyme